MQGGCVVLLSLSLLLSTGVTDGKVFTRCALTRELLQNHFPRTFMSNWVCLIEQVSERNTKAFIDKGPRRKYYGLFQIGSEWCKEGRPGGKCDISCEALLDDDIRDDGVCAMKVFELEGFKYWTRWEQKCKGQWLPDIEKTARATERMSRSRSRSRSRSATPAKSRRTLLFSNVQNMPIREPEVEEEPRIWKLPMTTRAREVQRTPRGSLYVGKAVDIVVTPGGSLRRHQGRVAKQAAKESIHVSALERAAAMDIDEEEAEEVFENNLDHVQKWFSDLQSLESVDPVPYSCNTPMPTEVDADAAFGDVSVKSAPNDRFNTKDHQVASVSASVDKDVRPLSLGMDGTSKRIAQVLEGSELDSDFDDEFNVEEFAASAGAVRDIPDDDELNEPERNIVNNVSRAMDEAFDRLVTVSTDFIWQSNYDTFAGKPEDFSGSTPGPIIDYDTPYEAFTDIWSKSFMEYIVQETNRYASQEIEKLKTAGKLKDSSRLHRWTPTDVDEMYVFFALYIFMGIDMRTSQHEYWKTTGYLEMPKFRQLMSYNRYILLNKFIHFADNSDASQNLPQSEGIVYSAKLAKIEPVLKHLNQVFSKLYNLRQDVSIDESLTLFKGRLSWVQSIRSKASRCGIKSYELCESKTGYMWRFDIYTGKKSESNDIVAPSVDLAGKSTQVVLDLLKGLENRGHLVTMDNFYNCPALARHLKSLGFDCLGTLRPNRKHVPVDVAKAPKNVAMGTIVARHSGDVSCIAWKDSKIVTLISTYHTDESVVGKKAGRDLVKPVAVLDYNNTMGGVDLKDQKLSMYLLERKRCVKWYMKIFKRLLNVSVLNAFILLTESLKRRGKPELLHRSFREQLADSLVETHRRSPPQVNLVTVPKDLRLRRDLLHVPQLTSGSKNRMNCRICARRGIDKKVYLKCELCDEAMCHGDCWRDWHSLQQLPGRDIVSRKGKRRH